jgi:hypothetical protein
MRRYHLLTKTFQAQIDLRTGASLLARDLDMERAAAVVGVRFEAS